MARQLKTEKEIDNFINYVIKEASHHAGGVEKVIYVLSEKVRNHLDIPKQGRVDAYERNGKLARTCWVITPTQKRYVFSYNYSAKKIELRDGSIKGRVLFQFDNNSLSDVENQISKL